MVNEGLSREVWRVFEKKLSQFLIGSAVMAIYDACKGVYQMSTKGLHVVPKDGKWSVRTAGASRSSGTFGTQREAVAVARERAKQNGTEMYIHGEDGRIRDRSTFGKDPYPPKG